MSKKKSPKIKIVNELSFDDVIQSEKIYSSELGQVYLMILSQYQPNMVLYIVKNRKLDPFYNDKKIEEFLVFVRENWGNYD